jgi:hypothetical protein
MSTTVQDYRRTDLRTNLGGDPFWVISGLVDGKDVSGLKDKACVLFSFPVTDQQIIISGMVVNVLTAFTATTTLSLGLCTLATNEVTTGGVATVTNDDAFIEVGDITATTAGRYYPTTGDFVDSQVSGTIIEGGNLIVGSSTNVPAIVLFPKVATIITGQVQVMVLISIIPGL